MSMNRRDFVGRSAALAAGGTLGAPGFFIRSAAAQEPGVESSKDSPVRLGVIGLNGRGSPKFWLVQTRPWHCWS